MKNEDMERGLESNRGKRLRENERKKWKKNENEKRRLMSQKKTKEKKLDYFCIR